MHTMTLCIKPTSRFVFKRGEISMTDMLQNIAGILLGVALIIHINKERR